MLQRLLCGTMMVQKRREQWQRCQQWLTVVMFLLRTVQSSATRSNNSNLTSLDLSYRDDTAFPPLNDHYIITVIHESVFLNSEIDSNTGEIQYNGYLMDMMRTLSQLAHFNFTIRTPSGFGTACNPQLSILRGNESNTTTSTMDVHPYDARYESQYNCGVNDVTDLQDTQYASDMYLGMYYLTPERQRTNLFTLPFQPPHRGTLVLVGTATHIRDVDDLIQQQAIGRQQPVCAFGSTAYLQFVNENFPALQVTPIFDFTTDALYRKMDRGDCDIFVGTAPFCTNFVRTMQSSHRCHAGPNNKRPIGIVAELEFGLSHFSVGVGKHIPPHVVNTLSYWMNVLMIDGMLASFYRGGTGGECGYVAFPTLETDDRLLSAGAIAGVVLGSVTLVVILPLYLVYTILLRRQKARYKKRFVQQLARNIAIGPRPGSIPPEKLSEQIIHIGQGKETISKEDLAKWMLDIKMDFISDKDFDALWHAIDIDDSGQVDAIEFIVFLSACGPEFERVYREQESLPKTEKLKLAARRLSNLSHLGENGVRRLEKMLERNSAPRHVDNGSSTFNNDQSLSVDEYSEHP